MFSQPSAFPDAFGMLPVRRVRQRNNDLQYVPTCSWNVPIKFPPVYSVWWAKGAGCRWNLFCLPHEFEKSTGQLVDGRSSDWTNGTIAVNSAVAPQRGVLHADFRDVGYSSFHCLYHGYAGKKYETHCPWSGWPGRWTGRQAVGWEMKKQHKAHKDEWIRRFLYQLHG